MGWDKDHKQRTRGKIADSAARLFTQRGFDNVGIDDVMSDAGLTRGAFYAHFSSKSELYVEGIISAAKAAQQQVVQPLPDNPGINQIAAQYLSREHREGREHNCPLAFLTTDVHQRDQQIRTAYTRVFKGFVRAVETPDSDGLSSGALQMAVLAAWQSPEPSTTGP